jgi:hypothetical protein
MSGSLGAKKDWWRDQRRFAKDIIGCHPIKYAPCNCHWPCGRCSKFISTFVANLLTSLGTSSLRVSLLGGRSFFAYCQRWRRGFLLQSILSASFHYFVPHLLKPGRRRRFRSHQMVSAQIIGKKRPTKTAHFESLGLLEPEWASQNGYPFKSESALPQLSEERRHMDQVTREGLDGLGPLSAHSEMWYNGFCNTMAQCVDDLSDDHEWR